MSYVETVLTMLEHGLVDAQSFKFILLSESCIPLKSFDNIYREVMQDDKSYLYHFLVEKRADSGDESSPHQYPDPATARDPDLVKMCEHFFDISDVDWVDGRYAEITDKTGIDRSSFHKFLAQGICFQRELAEFLVDAKADLRNYENVQTVCEYYYLCALTKRGIPFDRYVLRKNLMAVKWHGSRPEDIEDIDPSHIDRLISWGFCFARKVSAACRIDNRQIDYLLER